MSDTPTRAGATAKGRHPSGLYICFFAELWERFSFYGMRSLLTLYMTKALRYTDAAAYGVFHAYGAVVYGFPVVGGLLADRLLGYRLAILLGGVLMALGHFVMAIPHEVAMYVALGLICLGNGFFKPNISSLVGKLYPEGDPRRDGGFTIFYMGINIGAMLAPLICGYIGEKIHWHYGFSLAGIGMLGGLGWFLKGRAKLEGHGGPPSAERLTAPLFAGLNPFALIVVGCVVTLPVVALLLWRNSFVDYILYPVGVLVFGGLLVTGLRSDKVARGRLIVAIVLMLLSTLFWALFEQAGSSLTVFTDRHVDRSVLGWQVPASVFLAINPLFIISLAIPFAGLWTFLGRIRKNPSIPMKFSFGLGQLGAGFLVLILGASLAGADTQTGVIWLILMYLLHTTGELCLSPIGLSAMTKLAPKDLVGTVMGAWFLAAAFAQHFGGVIAKLTAAHGSGKAVSLVESFRNATDVFGNLGYGAIGIGVVVAVVSPLLRRAMHGVE